MLSKTENIWLELITEEVYNKIEEIKFFEQIIYGLFFLNYIDLINKNKNYC